MNQNFRGWGAVSESLGRMALDPRMQLNDGQRASLRAIAHRLGTNGVIIADEVGMGKTRIAAAVARCVQECGGRVAILVPPGLGYQWAGELRLAGLTPPAILRSLWQYLEAWKPGEVQPWFAEDVVVVSHAFPNWRLGERAAAWRCALLPELYAQQRKTMGRLPRGYVGDLRLRDEWVKSAAQSIANAAYGVGLEALQAICEETPWPGALEVGGYGENSHLRKLLERAVGLGLGVFDLVVIDEAHKSRGTGSGLDRLLDGIVLPGDAARRLALTATPVELEAKQWKQMLNRIGAGGERAAAIIEEFESAVRGIQECPHHAEMRARFQSSAAAFQKEMSPYLLRRDKRQDLAVQQFTQYTGAGWHEYRRETEIRIDLGKLDHGWRKAVCAAESLSLVTRQAEDSRLQRLRLTLGNGHGLVSLIDKQLRDKRADEEEQSPDPELAQESEPGETKRRARAKWWQGVMAAPFQDGESALYGHPAIRVAVEEIERVAQSEKVLVFGRYTRPLRALVSLLNAREMLRCVDAGRAWPHAKVGETEWGAVRAAHGQLGRNGTLDDAWLENALKKQYAKLELQRRDTREPLVRWLRKDVWTGSEEALPRVAAAMMEALGPDAQNEGRWKAAFEELMTALSDREQWTAEGKEEPDEDERAADWQTIEERLREEYLRTEGGFARLLNGDTGQSTRRLLQQGFQRRHGHPQVLVAQSQVGREGLNLHNSCRTVVMVHPEWNPGAVEQQIGRVDRLGSFWEEKMKEAMEMRVEAKNMPRIEFRAVVFEGTYDEWNWRVLRDRWAALRAHLHGVVIDGAVAARCGGLGELVAEINGTAPSFSPELGNT